ncbi:MAG: integrase [Stutzerimonas stutzeri]|nr:MAG: integrase [Stutzerimonas stutzeri]
MAISDAAIRNAKGRDKAYKLVDEQGLYLLVQTQGSRLWRMNYRFLGKQKTLAFGAYPAVGLADARLKRDAAKKLLAAGVDPAEQKREDVAAAKRTVENTFASVVADYLGRLERAGSAAATMDKNRWLLEKLAKPLHPKPISEITSADVLSVLQTVERSGRLESARRLRTAIQSVFRLAVKTLRSPGDPTSVLVGATETPRVENHAAITDENRLGWLMRSIDDYDGWPTIKWALQLSALTACRPGEVRLAEWSEFDMAKRTWTIPEKRMKMRREHEVPLSDQSVLLLDEVRRLTGNGRLLFSQIRNEERPISENAMNVALDRLGVAKTEHTPHGFRSSFSTILNERKEDPELIEMCLAHAGKDKVRSIYNRAEHWQARVELMQRWADLLDEFRRERTAPVFDFSDVLG